MVRRARRQRRILHAERPEQAVLEDGRKRLAVDLLGDEAEQVVVGVAVLEFGARREVRWPFERHAEYLVSGPHLVRILVEAFGKFRRIGEVIKAAPHCYDLPNGDLVSVGNTINVFRDQIVEAQFPFLDQLHDHGGGHRLGVRGGAEVDIRAWRVRGAEFGRSIAEDDVALRGRENNHGAGQHKFLGQPFDGGLKRGRVDRLEARRGRGHGAACRADHANNDGQNSPDHRFTP
jgi:hypothetical protein